MGTQQLEIYIKTDFIGFHRWKEAPKRVEFLRSKHRHKFYVKVYFKVIRKDRELEFFIMKNKIECFIEAELDKDNLGSCEMIAEDILNSDSNITRVEVSEDGENGVIFNK